MGLIWLALGAVALWALIRLGRQAGRPGGGRWRVSATLLAVAMIGAGGLAAMRGNWLIGSLLASAGLWLATGAPIRPAVARRPPPDEAMSLREARDTLGVDEAAGRDEINKAWKRLMARAHPDQGGTQGLAARLNAARDRLLKP